MADSPGRRPTPGARPQRASARQQFTAVLHKNLLLRLRSERTWFGLGGWVAAAADVLVPVLFFLVMCIPKHYMKPMPSPQQLQPLYPADMAGWGELYQGPAAGRPDGAARLLFAPNTSDVQRLMLLVAKAAACPPDAARLRRNSSTSFYRFWAASSAAAAAQHPECWGPAEACRAQPACYLPLFERQLVGLASGAEAEAVAAAQPGTVDAVLDFSAWQAGLDAARQQQGWQGWEQLPSLQQQAQQQQAQQQQAQQQEAGQQSQPAPPLTYAYTLRLNHSEVPPTRIRLNQFDLLPGNQWKQYWLFANLQALVEQAMLAHAAVAAQHPAAGAATPSAVETSGAAEQADGPGWAAAAAAASPPLLPLSLSVKGFPWPALTLDLGATAAALFFNMLLVFAFLQPTRAAVAAIVQEKELLLREGMRILGLQDGAYWASWFLTHWAGMAVSGLLCAAIGLYPFAHSSFLLMLAFYWLVAATLLLFAYCLSTLFSKARVAGGAAAVLYALAMMPGYLMPSLQPYGGPGWALSCLLPPSAISLFASVLVKHEATQQGLTWSTIGMPVTVEHSFSASDVYGMLLLDAALYSLLLWYLDKVMPSDVGQRLPWAFPLSPHHWRQRWRQTTANVAAANERQRQRRGSWGAGLLSGAPSASSLSSRDAPPAVRIEGLRKVFHTTDGMEKVAVDGLSLDIPRGQITALLGHNGAGKTTTISILSGVLPPTDGDAFFCTAGGQELSVRHDMGAIRGTLGVCPQFDVLWPQLSVREHLELWAAIKGFPREERDAVATAAAAEVGLEEKLGAVAGALSGGQRRKLSVALAFVGDPSVVILDEPSSGMDPYTRRLTWGVIQRRRAAAGTAVLLTTHSMEEADLLADSIAIMAHGRLAALGTSLQLKAQFGVGYTLTLSRQPAGSSRGAGGSADSGGSGGSQPGAGGQAGAAGGAADGVEGAPADDGGDAGTSTAALTAVVQQHIPGAQLLSSTAGEAAYRLPKEAAPAFPPLLRQLEADGPQLGVAAYGLSETTLEEVFLRVSESAATQDAAPSLDQAAAAAGGSKPRTAATTPAAAEAGSTAGGARDDRSDFVVVNLPRSAYLKGWALWRQQLRALLAKRALCALRDAWAALVQVAVPVLLVLLALWGGRASAAFPQQPPLLLDRPTALSGNPPAFGAAADVRSAGNRSLSTFLAGYPGAQDSGTNRVLTLPYLEPLAGSLDGWLLDQWYNASSRHYDAFFLQSLPPNLTGCSGGAQPAGGSSSSQEAEQLGPDVWGGALPSEPLQAVQAEQQHGWQPSAAGASAEVQYSVLANQTAIHGLPAAISQMHSVLLRWITGNPSASIAATSHPLPVLSHEQDMRITEAAGELLLVMCLVLAAAVLSASFAVVLVRERASGSKAVQRVAGVRASAFWAANLLFDLALFSLPAALMLLLFSAFHLPAFSGQRLLAVAALLWGFAPAGLCLTYLLQMAFQDEVRVLVRCNTIYFTSGYLGHLAVWILDTIRRLLPSAPGVERARRLLRLALQTLSPHFCLARGVHLVGQTYRPDRLAAHLGATLSAAGLLGSRSNATNGSDGSSGSLLQGPGGDGEFGPELPGGQSPWSWAVSGELLACLAGQALMYGGAVLLIETGVLPRLWRRARAAWRARGRSGTEQAGYQSLPGEEPGAAAAAAAVVPLSAADAARQAEAGEAGGEDPDVAAERRAMQSGRLPPASVAVLLQGVSKTFWQPAGGRQQHGHQHGAASHAHGGVIGDGSSGAVHAVRDLWLGIGRHEQQPGGRQAGAGSGGGECFGLLGVNGAGKTTTWRMVTGEVTPDTGDALVCGQSLLQRPSAARQLLGYCPQSSALPAQMTGREVMRLYARLRGLPERLVDPEAARLLKQLGLTEYADRACASYSGGNRRKLSVAVALVGGAPVILLDEPSTGMDPGARRALWGVIRSEMAAGRDVLLTSHSMEECEAVCSRVGIMAAGRLRALGTVQHLKQKHGRGYSLELRVAPGCAAAAEQLVAACCPAARRRAAHWRAGADGDLEGGMPSAAGAAGAASAADAVGEAAAAAAASGGGEAEEAAHLSFGIPQQHADLPALFAALEQGRSTAGVLEYSLSQTTLEQVFLEVAGRAQAQLLS